MTEEQNLSKAYKIDDIFIITKVYPYNERVFSVNIEQDNIETEYCKKSLKWSIYSLGYIICIPCILTNLCININCNVCRICQ